MPPSPPTSLARRNLAAKARKSARVRSAWERSEQLSQFCVCDCPKLNYRSVRLARRFSANLREVLRDEWNIRRYMKYVSTAARMRGRTFAVVRWGFTILCRSRSSLAAGRYGSLVIGLENASSWISKSAVSAEPFASTLVHLADSPVTLIAEN